MQGWVLSASSWVAGAFLAGLLAVPAAVAQNPGEFPSTFTIDSIAIDKAVLTPDVEVGIITVQWTYEWQNQAAAFASLVTPTAELSWEQPTCAAAGFVLAGSLHQSVPLSGSGPVPPTSVSGTSTFIVAASAQAPGETAVDCSFSGRVGAVAGSPGSETEPDSEVVQLEVAFLGLISASIPTTITEAGPQKEIQYEIELTNLGNSLTKVQFEVNGPVPPGWHPVAPTPIILQSRQQGGSEFSRTVVFLVQTPHKEGWNNDETTFQLKMTPTSTKDSELEGDPISGNFLARVRGCYVSDASSLAVCTETDDKSSPGIGPLLIAGLVAGALMARRRIHG